jgi:hypothetical protein
MDGIEATGGTGKKKDILFLFLSVIRFLFFIGRLLIRRPRSLAIMILLMMITKSLMKTSRFVSFIPPSRVFEGRK